MSKSLVIIESPAKCGKIQKYLGNQYIVKASFGHIRNLNKKKGIKAINIENNFKPSYSIIPCKQKYIKELKKHAKKCKEVIIATDLDREGEAIGYHIAKVLNLNLKTTKRIVYKEISKIALQNAIKNPRLLDINLINAQQARLILDYIIGFEISPVLWKYIRNHLSAGRCQSPALRLICDKNHEITNFNSKTYYDISGTFGCNDNIKYEATSTNIMNTKLEVISILELFKTATFKIYKILNSESKSKPPAPYITSTIQQDASNKLGLSLKVTMNVLQKLYEAGKITYMRTDSKVLSEICTNEIKEFVINKYGIKYHKMRKYKNKTQNVQEAHECIRPVDIKEVLLDNFSNYETKLYSMIWKRTIASQMSEMITSIMKIEIKNNKNNFKFSTKFSKTIFLGYGIIYNLENINEIDKIRDYISDGKILKTISIISTEKITKASSRYTEASLVKNLEKNGIGRPSTYSSIVDTLFKRNYIIKESKEGIEKNIFIIELDTNNNISEKTKQIKLNSENKKLFVTDLGKMVNKFMIENFNSIVDYKFTSEIETTLDNIANGESNWVNLLDNSYKSFHPKVIKLLANVPKKVWKNEKKVLGINPKNNKNIYCYKGKYGPVIQEGDEDIKYVGLSKKTNISDITIETVLDILDYPKFIAKYNNKEIDMYYGQNGYYIKYNNKSYSITNKNITLDEIKQIIKEKNKSIIKEFSNGISIRVGEYGPYILKSGKKAKIVSVPIELKDKLDKIKYSECLKILNSKNKFKK